MSHERIIFEAHGLSDPYPLLSKASILITDYSSIYADFLLLDRPIIFANFDHKSYIDNERGLYWDYDKVTPGVKASDWNAVIQNLETIIVKKQDYYKEERARMVEMIYEHPVEEILEKVTQFVSS